MMEQYAPYLIGLGSAALAFWWLNRKPAAPEPVDPFTPDDVTPARKNRFDAIEGCWYTIAGLADHAFFKGNEEAQAAIAKLKNIVVEELKK